MVNGKLALCTSLVGLLALSSGCIISSNDSNNASSGVYHATWDLNGSTGAATCASVSADKVSFLFTPGSDPNHPVDELFDCSAFAGSTNPFPIDNYTYVATLLSCPNTQAGCPGGTDLSDTGALSDNFYTCNSVSSGVCFVDLPTIAFQH